jgi:hypothetical protein
VLSRANLFSKWRQTIILLDIIQRGWKMSGGSCPHPMRSAPVSVVVLFSVLLVFSQFVWFIFCLFSGVVH